MKFKLLLLSTLLFSNAVLAQCPKVEIRDQDSKIKQIASYKEVFEIEITGYTGHCDFDENLQKVRAFVKPQFKITRLQNSNIEDVHFSYYLETAEGPKNFLGRKTYFAEVTMPVGVWETSYTPDYGELTVPDEDGMLNMYAGLNANIKDSEFKLK